MANVQCVSSPTLTSSSVGTTRSVTTTTSRFVTTLPASLFTSFITTCSTASLSTICTTSTSVTTRPGTTITTQEQVPVTVSVSYTYRTTLYGSSCSTLPGDAVISTTPTPTPVVSTVTSSSVYTSDGTAYTTVVTSLSSEPPPAQSTGATTSSSSNSKIPAIVGGAFGGIVVLALLTVVAWKFLKKPRISFDKEDNFNHPTKQQQPYHYTPVGQQETQTVAQAFSNDTGLQPTNYGNDTAAFNNGVAGGDTLTQYTAPTNNGIGPTAIGNEAGFQPGVTGNDVIYNIPNHGLVHQMPSLTPMAAGSAAIVAAGAAARPNSTLSSTPYMTSSDPTMRQMNYPPNIGYVPQQYPQYPSPYASHPTLLATYPQQPYGPPPQGQGQRPLSHNLSVGSTMSVPSPGVIGSTGPSVDFMPSFIQPGQTYPQPQQPFGQHPYGDSVSGSQSIGSAGPVDNQVLQVRNPGSDAFVQDPSTTFNTPSLVVGPPSSASSPPPMDGKGRALDAQGEKAAIVHLDGGAYNGESSAPAPPAYRE